MAYQAEISFTPPSPAPVNGYRVKYRIAGSLDPYSIITGASSPITITGLTYGVNYEGYIESDCSIQFSAGVEFNITSPTTTTTSTTTTTTTSTSSTTTTSTSTTTTTTAAPCTAPTGLGIFELEDITPLTYNAVWTAVSGAISYSWELYEGVTASGTPILTGTTVSTDATLTPLNFGTNYTFRVKTTCESGESGWSTVVFSTEVTTTTTSTSSTSTTTLPLVSLHINKDIINDDISVSVTPSAGGATVIYECNPGITLCDYVVLTQGVEYDIVVSVTPSGRPDAPISIVDGTNTIVSSCPNCVGISANNVIAGPANIQVEVGL
jgi:hypothetical protein